MVGYIKGRILASFNVGKAVSSLVIWPHVEEDILGVGYSVVVSDLLAAKLPMHGVIELWLYTVQTDKESYVIGLESVDAMTWFIKLLTVSGIGPKTALQIVDVLEVSGIKEALAVKDIKLFTKVPGLGQKSAAKIIIELGGKEGQQSAVDGMQTGNDELQVYAPVIATLQRLGWKAQEAKDAVKSALPKLQINKDQDVSEQVKLVLAYLR